MRPGDEVNGVFACTRKDRLTARTGTPYLALELRDRSLVDVVDHALVPVPHQAADEARAHSTQTDHSQLHEYSFDAMDGSDEPDCKRE